MDAADGTQASLERLPVRHLAALRAALAGFDDGEIAGLLGIPPEAVRTTLRLAAAKLVSALAEHPRPPPEGPRTASGDVPSSPGDNSSSDGIR